MPDETMCSSTLGCIMSIDMLEVDDVLKESISKDNSSTINNDERNEYLKET